MDGFPIIGGYLPNMDIDPALPTVTPAATPEAAAEAPSTSGPSIDQIKLALRRVKDPDLNLNIVDLGLVYDVRVDGAVTNVDVTLTSPACPSGPEIIGEIEREVATIPGVERVQVNLIWTPFWTPDRIEPRVRAYLGL